MRWGLAALALLSCTLVGERSWAQDGPAQLEPVRDRFRLDVPPFDRYGGNSAGINPARGPFDGLTGTEYPWEPHSSILDPYNQNVLKGDLPIIGDHTFLEIDLVSDTIFTYRRDAGGVKDVEKQNRILGEPDEWDFVGAWFASADLTYGDTVFRNPSWRLRVTPAIGLRDATIVTADKPPPFGTLQNGLFSLQEGFVEVLLAEFDPSFDFISARGGRQQFDADFRGFVFNDLNQAVRVFGTASKNTIRYDVIAFDLDQKNTFTNLNNFLERQQRYFAADIFVDDFIFKGYTIGGTLQYVNDREREPIDLVYLGLLGQGHMGPIEVSNAAYLEFGADKGNALAGGKHLEVFGQFFATEVAYPIDFVRPQVSFLFSSGQANTQASRGEGFDGVFDNPDFAGGAFTYWQRNAIKARNGAQVKDANSLYPALRVRGATGPNSVVPGLLLYNVGCKVTVSNTLTVFANLNYLRFVHKGPLEQIAGLQSVGHGIGEDTSVGAIFRPLGINNLFVIGGVSMLTPDTGLRQLSGSQNLFTVFTEIKGVF
ncbi:MAG TPA: hypothetical protein VFF73_15035 [Planctomycetota bacterium]|nr:hypothetical protein [Planctomycetota bacterium]